MGGGAELRISFYGVRGSCPTSGEGYVRYGGHTACIAVEVDDEPPIVIDLGTGLRPFGYDLDSRSAGGPVEVTAFLSHLHWDHIIGLPFCTPLLREEGVMEVYGPPQEQGSLCEAIDEVVKPPFFPVTLDGLNGKFRFHEVADDDLTVGSAKVKVRLVPHVGTTLGFRIEAGGTSAAFIFDHQAPDDKRSVAKGVLELCDGADLLVHDAQYTDSEYEAKSTWGHSTIRYALNVAAEAGARMLALFHHDPTHLDSDMDDILAGARSVQDAGRLDSVMAAAEGVVIDLGDR
jgi:phosphoribosyl 1,2-cyclic phosphodiesterase